MISPNMKLALGVVAAAAIASIAGGVAFAQQNVDATREKCLQQAFAESPSQGAEKGNRRALEIYQTCMISHGLKP
jgi:hypothetical protein